MYYLHMCKKSCNFATQNMLYMSKKEIQFSLVYRDMWQSSGKYVPRKDQLARIAPVIIDMGCFDRVETNGGASSSIPKLPRRLKLKSSSHELL